MEQTPDLTAIAHLIRQLRRRLRWKPGAAARHLLKRKLRGHLPAQATLSDYEHVIHMVLSAAWAEIYVYYAGEEPYLTIAAQHDDRIRLVITGFDGLLETAFVVENPETYLHRPSFQRVGEMAEVVK